MAEPTIRAEGGVEEAPARIRFQIFSSLSHVNFRYLWAGTMLMSAGQWIQQVTLGWLLYELTGSSVLLGMLNGLRLLPFLVAGPLAGVAADRTDRRKLLLNAESVLVLTTLGMGVLVASGVLAVWHLFLFTLVTGIAWSFNEPVRQSLIPNIVPKKDLVNAVALNSMGFNLNKIIGPALAGFLIVLFGAAGNFFVQGLAYAGVFLTIYLMQVPPTPREARRASVFANLKEGFLYIWSNPVVLTLIVADLLPRLFAVPYQVLMPVFQKDVHQVGPEGLGLLMAAPGIGAVLALLLIGSIASAFRRKGLLLIGCLISLGLFLVLFSRTTSFPLALLTLVGVGASQMLYMTTTNAMLQMIVPDALRGRVMSLYMLDRGLIPAGSLLVGLSAHLIGAPATVGVMGLVVIALALLVAWRVPRFRTIES